MTQIDLDAVADAVAGRVVEQLAPRVAGAPADKDVLLNETGAAQLLGLQPATLTAWRSRGRLGGEGPPFIRLGDSKKPAVRYKRADLISWANQRRHRNTGSKIGAEDKEGLGDG